MMDITAEQAFNIATSVVATASVIAAVFPMPQVNPVLVVVRKVLDIFAFNFGAAKNQSQVEADKCKDY